MRDFLCSPMFRFRIALLLWFSVGLAVGRAYAEDEDPVVSVGLRAGLYRPSLRTFNRVTSDRTISIIQDPNFLLPRNPQFPANERTINTPSMGWDADYGADIAFRLNKEFSIVLSTETWSTFVVAQDTVPFLIRQDEPYLFVPRSARFNLQINQYFVSWRYHFFNQPRKKNFYFDLGLLGLAQANLTMDALMNVVSPIVPNGGFASISSTEATGYGFVFHTGIGGEYFLTRWLSVGLQAQYVLGNIDKLKITRVFESGFAGNPAVPSPPGVFPQPFPPPEAQLQAPNVFPTPQPSPLVGQVIGYAPVTVQNSNREVWPIPQNLPIELDGYDITFLFRIHF